MHAHYMLWIIPLLSPLFVNGSPFLTQRRLRRALNDDKGQEAEYSQFDTIFPHLPPDDAPLQVGDYYSLRQIEDFMETRAKGDTRLQMLIVGSSEEGRPIKGIQIGIRPNARTVVIDSGIHAREWTAVHVAYYMIDRYTSLLRDNDTSMLKLLEHYNIIVVPVLNPDGYEYTRHTEASYKHRLWRKNRSPARCNDRGRCCKGIDLNRNWPVAFGEGGTTDSDPCRDVFQGETAFSASETRTFSAWLRTVPNLAFYITLHSHGQLWLYPYAYAPNTYPENIDRTIYVVEKALAAIEELNGTRYLHGTPADVLYESSGSSMDWVQITLKPDYVFGIEVRPQTERNAYGFILPKEELIPASEEIYVGVRTALETAIALETRAFKALGSSARFQAPRVSTRKLASPVTVLSQADRTAIQRMVDVDWREWLGN